jgi:hypothetical protein
VTGINDPRLPVCVMEKGSVLFRPTIRDLAAALDWFRGPKHERQLPRLSAWWRYDLAILWSGTGWVERCRIRGFRRIENHRSLTVCRRRASGKYIPDRELSRISRWYQRMGTGKQGKTAGPAFGCRNHRYR